MKIFQIVMSKLHFNRKFFSKSFLVCEIYLDLRTEKSHNVTLNTILWIKKEFIPLEMVRQKEKLT